MCHLVRIRFARFECLWYLMLGYPQLAPQYQSSVVDREIHSSGTAVCAYCSHCMLSGPRQHGAGAVLMLR